MGTTTETVREQFAEASRRYQLVRVHMKGGGALEGLAGHYDSLRFTLDNRNTCEPHFTCVRFAEAQRVEVIG